MSEPSRLAFLASTLLTMVAFLNGTLIAVFALGAPLLAAGVGVAAPVVLVLSLAVANKESTPVTRGGEPDPQTDMTANQADDGGIAAE